MTQQREVHSVGGLERLSSGLNVACYLPRPLLRMYVCSAVGVEFEEVRERGRAAECVMCCPPSRCPFSLLPIFVHFA